MIKSIKGTRDILPAESPRWHEIEEISRKVFGLFGYREIRTPIIEETALFTKSVGEDTDIVKKEMFSFVDRGERDITLRPEGTAPVVRAYLENNLYNTEPFQKLFYMGPMFRAERPQAGRLRQFYQIGLEAIGSSNPALDAEVISVLVKLLDSLGVVRYGLKLNNLGCPEDKKKLSGSLRDIFSKDPASAGLCEDCKRRIKTNPLRLLDCKNEDCRKVVRGKYETVDFLCGECVSQFNELTGYLGGLGIKYEMDRFIVRGLDYYTRTVFEVVQDDLGAQNSIGAGGRYDNLISDMGGPKLGACGFAIGVDRVVMALGKSKGETQEQSRPDVYIAAIGPAAYRKAVLTLNELRCKGISGAMDYESRSLKSQMRAADKAGAKYVFIIGDDEIGKGEAALRDMHTKEQWNIKFEDFGKVMKERIETKV